MGGADQDDILHGASLLVRTGGAWSVPPVSSYDDEAMLRDLIVENPTILPNVTQPAAAVAEFGLPGTGSADVVAVESNGMVTVCEAKLAANPEIRRKIVGQVFAYAAAIRDLTVRQFEDVWERRAGCSLGSSIFGANPESDDLASFTHALSNTLADGRFRIVMAVDEITDELRSIIEYLAEHSELEVIGLQLGYSRVGDTQILVPQSWGTELARQDRKKHGTARSSGHRSAIADAEHALIAQAEESAVGYGAVVQRLLNAVGSDVDYLYSGSETMLDPVLVAANGPRRQPLKIITSQNTVGVRVCFHWCGRLPKSQLDEALRILEADAAIAPLVSEVRDNDYRRGPLLPFDSVLERNESLEALVEAALVLFQA